jgi:hypothetical protein
MYPSIKITASPLDRKEVTFLDLSISIDVDRKDDNGLCPIVIKSWDKPLNKHLYIPYSSYCPKHIFKGFIKGRVIALAINNTKKEDFVTSLRLLKDRLMRRGYPSKFINSIFKLVSHEDRMHYLGENQKSRNNNRNFGLHVNFTPKTHEFLHLKHLIRRVYNKHKDDIKDIVPTCPFVGFYRGTTIGKIFANSPRHGKGEGSVAPPGHVRMTLGLDTQP